MNKTMKEAVENLREFGWFSERLLTKIFSTKNNWWGYRIGTALSVRCPTKGYVDTKNSTLI